MNEEMFEREQMEENDRLFATGDGYSRDELRFGRYFEYLEYLEGMVDCRVVRVLDVGCGPGPLEVHLKRRGYVDVTAVDYSCEGLRRAAANTPGYRYVTGNVKELSLMFVGVRFDLIFCLQVLEHIPSYVDVFGQMCGLLSDGGIVVVSVPWDRCKDNRWHVNHFLPADFERLASEFGMDLMVTERFGENALQLLAIMRGPR